MERPHRQEVLQIGHSVFSENLPRRGAEATVKSACRKAYSELLRNNDDLLVRFSNVLAALRQIASMLMELA